MTRYHWDTTQLDKLTDDLLAAPERMHTGANNGLRTNASELHKIMRKDATGHRFLKSFAPKVAKEEIGDLEWEVGFNKRGQGSLANIIAFGSVNNAPVYDFYAPLYRQAPKLEADLADAAEDAVLGGEG